ncbi:unnamed protein product [Leuciscus chuanchicus]
MRSNTHHSPTGAVQCELMSLTAEVSHALNRLTRDVFIVARLNTAGPNLLCFCLIFACIRFPIIHTHINTHLRVPGQFMLLGRVMIRLRNISSALVFWTAGAQRVLTPVKRFIAE